MAIVNNLNQLVQKLELLKRKGGGPTGNVSVNVGYTAPYAVYVHENLQARHPIGEAKFLERPAREMQGELKMTIVQAMKSGATLGQALLLAGLKLQRASQLRVPIDTGYLKSSAFTRLEEK